MNVIHNMGTLVFLLILQLFPAVISSFIFGRGVVLPVDPYVFIGQRLLLTCNLTSYELGEDSSALYFTRKNNELISKRYLHILSTRSIQLNMPIKSVKDEGNYICKLNKTVGRPAIIGNQHVEVEYEVKAVEKIDCLVYNWENMTCTWDLGQEYIHPEHLSVTLAWTINGPQYDCPHQTATSCSWLDNDNADTFKDDMWYIMKIIVTNNRKEASAESKIFRINTRSIVKPAAVSDIVTWENSTCISLKWTHPHTFRGITYRLELMSQWDQSKKWKEIYSGGLRSFSQCDLTPYTKYQIRLTCKPSFTGFWSDFITDDIQTNPSVPGAPPTILPGSFVEQFCLENDCRKVRIYWKPLEEKYRHGNIISYTVTVEDTSIGGKGEPFYFNGNVNSGELRLRQSHTYIAQIAASTRQGVSPFFSSFILPAISKKPSPPNNFIVEASHLSGGTVLTLRWDPIRVSPDINWRKLIGYTVYWCRGSHLTLICEDPVWWEILDADKQNFTIRLQDTMFHKYLFGISLEVESFTGENIISSGLKWNDCIYRKNLRPHSAPKNFRLSNFQPDHCLSLEWDSLQCHEKIGHIQSFLIRYCPAMASENCTGPVSEMRLSGKARKAVVNNLMVGQVYKVWIVAESSSGQGPESIAVYEEVIDRSLKPEEVAGLVMGIIFILIICIFGVFVGLRRFVKFLKHHIEVPQITLPNVDLPDLPLPPRENLPRSESEDDSIYAEIGNPNGLPTPTSPESSSANIPLISAHTNTHSKNQFFMQEHRRNSDSGRGSLTSTVETLPTRLHFTPNFTGNEKINIRSHNTLPCSDVSPYSCVNIVDGPSNNVNNRNHLSKYVAGVCYSGDSSNSGTSSSSSSSYSPSKIYAFAAKIRALIYKDNLENVPHSVEESCHGDDRNYVQRPMICNITGCEEENVNNLSGCSVIDNAKCFSNTDFEQSSSHNGEHILTDKIRNDMPFETDSVCPGSHSGMSYCLVGTDQPTSDVCYDSSSCKKDGYVTDQIFKEDSHHNVGQNEKSSSLVQTKCNNVNKLSVDIQPGPRPISSVINVPAHFYGSLSLLDNTNSTEL